MIKKTDLRIERTYLFLHEAFTSFLEEKRFEDITVNELCERAMIRRTTFYKHFADKYEYFTFYMKEICKSFRSQLPPNADTDNFHTYFLYMNRELLRFMEEHQKLVQNIASSTVFPVLCDILSDHIMYDILQMLHENKIFSKSDPVHREGIAAFLSGGLLNVLRLYIKTGTPIDEKLFLETISLCLPSGNA